MASDTYHNNNHKQERIYGAKHLECGNRVQNVALFELCAAGGRKYCNATSRKLAPSFIGSFLPAVLDGSTAGVSAHYLVFTEGGCTMESGGESI